MRQESIVDNDGDGEPEDNRETGYDVEVLPFSAICKLKLSSSFGMHPGTGFLIKRNFVLTAAHNIFLHGDSDYIYGGTALFENGDKLKFAKSELRVLNSWHQSFKKADDIGIIKVNQAPSMVNQINIRAPSIENKNDDVVVAGYDRYHSVGEQHRHKAGLEYLGADFLYYSVDTKKGQSGSPVLLPSGDAAAIHSYGISPGAAVPLKLENVNFGIRLTEDKILQIYNMIEELSPAP